MKLESRNNVFHASAARALDQDCGTGERLGRKISSEFIRCRKESRHCEKLRLHLSRRLLEFLSNETHLSKAT